MQVAHFAEMVAHFCRNNQIEGNGHPEGIAILEFPGCEEAKAWYENPIHNAAKEHRLRSGTYRSFIVEGV